MTQETPGAAEPACPHCASPVDRGARLCPECGKPVSAGSPPVGTAADWLDYDVVGRRIAAALIDVALLSGLFLLMAATFGDFGWTDDTRFSIALTGGPALIYFLLVFAYYIVLEGLSGATPGKMVMGLKVVRSNGEAYEWGAVLLRNVLRIVDALPVLYLVGIICVAVRSKNQRIGDLAAGTLVISMR